MLSHCKTGRTPRGACRSLKQIKNKELYVARGIATFADALMRQHHVDRGQCIEHLQALLKEDLKEWLYEATRKT